jgi:MYXO-CTERM domain-containing protein
LFALDDAGGEQLVAVTSSGDLDCEAWALNAEVAPGTEWITSTLAAIDDTPDGWSAAELGLDEVCAQECTTDLQCPAAMSCLVDETGGHCAIPGLAAGDMLDSCSSDDDCGGDACVQVWPDACQCHAPCQDLGFPDDSGPDSAADSGGVTEPSCGCSATSASTAALWSLPILVVLLRRRSRSCA